MEENRSIFDIIVYFMEWITRIAYINLLWMFFTLLGGIVFGFSPATASLFAVTRKWCIGELDIPIFKTFWNTYRSQFLRANLQFLPIVFIAYIIILDYQLIGFLTGPFYYVMFFILINISILLLITSVFLFPVYVHYKLSYMQYFKSSLYIGIIHPIHTIVMFISIYLVSLLMETIPGLIPVIPIGLTGLMMMRIAWSAFKKLENKFEAGSSTPIQKYGKN